MTSHIKTFAPTCPRCAVEEANAERMAQLLQDTLIENQNLREDVAGGNRWAAGALLIGFTLGVIAGNIAPVLV